MNLKNYETLKSNSVVSFSKEIVDGENHYFLTQKRFDPNTGSSLSDLKISVDLNHFEQELNRINSEISNLEQDKIDYTKIIEDIKAL